MKRLISLLVLVFGLLIRTAAQSSTPVGVWTFTDIEPYTYWLGGLVPSGASVNILYDGSRLFRGVDTIFETDVGAGWQSNDFYRNPDGSPYLGPDETPTTFDQAEFLDDIGVRQGLAWDDARKRNLVEAFLFYRLRYDRNSATPGNEGALVFGSNFPDRIESFVNSVHAGFSLNTVGDDAIHKTHSGLYSEASVEWGPRMLFNGVGDADFYRLNFALKGFRPFYATSNAEGDMNRLSLYLADYFEADYAGGQSIPISVFEGYGGRYERASNTLTIHGLEDGLYGTDLKIINNLELRLTGPAIIFRDLVPGLFVFFDAAFCDGYFRDPVGSPAVILASTGIGIYLDFFELANLNAYFAFPIFGSRLDGRRFLLDVAISLAI